MDLASELLSDLEGSDDDDYKAANECSASLQRKCEEKNDSLTKLIESDDDPSEKHLSLDDFNLIINQIVIIIAAFQCCNHLSQDLLRDASTYNKQIEKLITKMIAFVKQSYHARFPELDSIIPNEIEYVRVVKLLGNKFETGVGEALQSFLKPALIMITSVTAATTTGQPLSGKIIGEIDEACDKVISLNSYKSNIFQIVESRVSSYAPNVAALLGEKVAAKLFLTAGGLHLVTKMNKYELLQLGLDSKGYSRETKLLNEGHIYSSELVQTVPFENRSEIVRKIAEKTLLAALIDVSRESADGIIGRNFYADIKNTIKNKFGVSNVKVKKRLSQAHDIQMEATTTKKNHEMKKRFNISEMRQQQNRMSFADYDIESKTLSHETRKIDGAPIDEETRLRIKKVLMKNLESKTSHRASSVVKLVSDASCTSFTPLQGLEINNPSAVEKLIGDANRKYFSNTSGFMSVKAIDKLETANT